MARVYAYGHHWYTHFNNLEQRVEYLFPAGEWREVPEDVARIVTEGAPEKLVILAPGQNQPDEGAEEVVETVAEPAAEPPKKGIPLFAFKSIKKGR